MRYRSRRSCEAWLVVTAAGVSERHGGLLPLLERVVWKRSPRENSNEETTIWRGYSPLPLWETKRTSKLGPCEPEDAADTQESDARTRAIPDHLQRTRARLSQKLEAWLDSEHHEARRHHMDGPLAKVQRSDSRNDDEQKPYAPSTPLVPVRIPFEDVVLDSEPEEEEEMLDTECPVASFAALKQAKTFPQNASEELDDTKQAHEFLRYRPLTEVESLKRENEELREKLRELRAQNHHHAPEKSLLQHLQGLLDLVNR